MLLSLQFGLFLLVVVSTVGAAHYYLWRRLVRDTRFATRGGMLFVVLLVLAILAVPLSRFLTKTVGGGFSKIFAWVAYGWLGFCFYAVLLLLVIDVGLFIVWKGPLRQPWKKREGRGERIDCSPINGVSQGQGENAPREPRGDGLTAVAHGDEESNPKEGEAEGSSRSVSSAHLILRGTAFDPGRRLAIRRLLYGGAALLSSSILMYGAHEAFSEPVITELPLKLRGLPRTLSGITIAHITDVHIGALVDARFLRRIVELVNRLAPDMIAITGDLFDRPPRGVGAELAELARLRSRFGTFFVTGNHEYYVGADLICAALRGIGVRVLANERVSLGNGKDSFDIVGVNDYSAGRRFVPPVSDVTLLRYDLEGALLGRDPERAAVLLAHQPRDFEKASSRGVGLQLSGHTHGGQMFPFIVLSKLIYPHVRGYYRIGEAHLYVSRGVGFWGPPFRVLAPPEIVKVVLI